MEIHLLDMGTTKYGDSILILRNNKSILIDGGHPGDTNRIRMQLKKLMKKDPPFAVDLLIVTHCHLDHIGCLPDLVNLGDLKPKMALLADPKTGFAESEGSSDMSDAQKSLTTALQEEDHADMNDDDLEQFLFDAVKLKDKYNEMIKILKKNIKQSVIFFNGPDQKTKAIETKFKDFGLKILGPTKQHLKLCADSLRGSGGSDLIANFSDITDDIDSSSLINIYRTVTTKLSQDALALQDMTGPGAAKNDQSIVVSVKADGWNALLGADMQFALAQVTGLDAPMAALLAKVDQDGPYDFIKLSHHSSYNGLNETILNKWNSHTKLFAHSGGLNDPTHPDEGVLKLLKAKKNDLTYARTDRNGLISVIEENGQLSMVISKGKLNDFTENKKNDTIAKIQEEEEIKPEVVKTQPRTTNTENPDGTVEVITRIPNESTRVTVTIDVDASKKKPSLSTAPATLTGSFDPKNGGRFSGLLFVTSSAVLEKNIGQEEAHKTVQFLKTVPGARLLDVPPHLTTDQAATEVRAELKKGTYKGVVVLGGYDVIPAQQLDVLDEKLRKAVVDDGYDNSDADDFIIWSDDYLVDLDGDSLPEMPISRIPDGRSAELVFNALNAKSTIKNARFGIRNIARPFATGIFSSVPGPSTTALAESRKFNPGHVKPDTAVGSVYFMLHGSDSDATSFWGEADGGSAYEAFNIQNIPKNVDGTIVFTGCCWGALTALPIASRKSDTAPIRPRSPEQSIALSYLKSGANAFIGCTGSHYSPGKSPYDYFGGPMHTLFWKEIIKGSPPSLALFNARKRYASGIPHADAQSFNQAIELKIFREYTCLGLGW